MAENSENQEWRKKLKSERNVGDGKAKHYNQPDRSGDTIKSEIELNSPGDMLRQNRDGSFDKAQRHVTPNPVTLDKRIK